VTTNMHTLMAAGCHFNLHFITKFFRWDLERFVCVKFHGMKI